MKTYTNSAKNYIYQEGYEAALAGLLRNSNAYKGLDKIRWENTGNSSISQGFDTGLVFIYKLANGGGY